MPSIKKIWLIGRTYRHLNRYRQILAVFIKYGFGGLIEQLNIDQYIEIGLRMISRKRGDRFEKHTRMERIRMALEELGPTYIKLGQALSTRPDLIPAEFIDELSKLQDDVPPFSFDEAVSIIETELNEKSDKLFDFIKKTPIASASVAQVHRARLQDGDDVAVKVQRPGIRKVIEVDLEIMLHLASLIERHIDEMAVHQPVKIVEEFAKNLEKEIDFTIESANMVRFAKNFSDESTVYIPKVYREMSTARILTMEVVDGIKISETDRIEKAGLDRKIITRRGADLLLKQVFVHGFFHADPHPGNIFVLPGNVICFVDFGVVGSVDIRTREDFVELVDSVVHQDESRAAQVILKIAESDDLDIRRFEKDLADFMGQHLYGQLKDIKIGKLLQHLMGIVSSHNLKIPPDIFLMLKAIVTFEGVGLMLDPDFDMIEQAAPFIKRIRMDRFSPKRITDDILRSCAQLIIFLKQFPKDILEITDLIKYHKRGFKIEHQGVETFLSTLDQISNRISFSIIIGALLIGSAIVINSEIPPLFYGVSLIGIIGFFAAAIMGIWLLVAILKKGRL